jgi:hypothetical protein
MISFIARFLRQIWGKVVQSPVVLPVLFVMLLLCYGAMLVNLYFMNKALNNLQYFYEREISNINTTLGKVMSELGDVEMRRQSLQNYVIENKNYVYNLENSLNQNRETLR